MIMNKIKRIFKFLFIGVLSTTAINAQAPINCLSITTSTSTNVSSILNYTPVNTPCFYNNSASQYTLVEQYIPTASTPTLVYRVNFVFIVDNVIPSPVTSTPISSLQTGAQLTISQLNSYFVGLGNVASNLPVLNPTGTIPDTKIRFQLNQVYKVTHVNAPTLYNNCENYYPYTTDNAVNIYFNYRDPSDPIAGTGAAKLGTGLLYIYDSYAASSYTGGGFYTNLLSHELCHALGSLPDHYTTNTVIPTSMPTATFPGNYNSPGVNSGYIPDDAALDILQSYNCSNLTDPTYPYRNNNMMGNSFCRNHLSKKQIAAFHYLVAKGFTSKFTQYLNYPYPFTPTILIPPTILNTAQTLTGSINISTLTIPNGADVTINNATIAVAENGKIIVEPGAKLNLNNVVMHALTTQWEGIEVRSSLYQLQPPAPITSTMSNFSGTGLLFMTNCCVENARIGLLMGKRNWIGSNVQTYEGGGLVVASYCNFTNNRTHVLFDGYNPITINYNIENLSRFEKCIFLTDEKAMLSLSRPPTREMVKLFDSKKVNFYSCQWEYYNRENMYNDTVFGIFGYKTAVRLTKSPSGPTNKFFNLIDYGVFLLDPDRPSNIEDADFQSANGIYINESSLDKIVRNNFKYSGFVNNTNDAVGIYLQNCTNYKVENNIFSTYSGNKVGKIGIVVNNSGPNTNKIYNNTFSSIEQGIWCQNQNYDPLTNNGLVLNCNDFANVDYNIGVQKDYVPSNNTGIAEYQGNLINPLQSTRNTYNTPACVNENKFYSFTPYDLPPQVQHPNYQNPQFKVSPQPGCSDAYEINDISNLTNAPVNKSTYCANTSTLPAGKSAHINSVSNLNLHINSLQNAYTTNLDNGNTQNLLNLISFNNNAGQLKNELMATPYLSDTVLISYFSKVNTPPGHAKQIHSKNAPVSRKVWQTITNQNYPNGIYNQMQNTQNANVLSPRSNTLSQISVLTNDRNYELMHYSQALYNDSVNTNIKDSLAQIIINSQQTNATKQLIDLDISFNNYDHAQVLLQEFAQSNTEPVNQLYINFMYSYLNLLRSETGVLNINNDAVTQNLFIDAANNQIHPCKIIAQNVLCVAMDRQINIQVLKPVATAGNKFLNQNQTNNSTVNNFNNLISVYPNPAKNQFNISNFSKERLNVQVYNCNGQLILSQNIPPEQNQNINNQNWLSGIYFITLSSQSQQLIKTQKLIIEN